MDKETGGLPAFSSHKGCFAIVQCSPSNTHKVGNYHVSEQSDKLRSPELSLLGGDIIPVKM